MANVVGVRFSATDIDIEIPSKSDGTRNIRSKTDKDRKDTVMPSVKPIAQKVRMLMKFDTMPSNDSIIKASL